MENSKTITLTRTIKASIEKVWQAWTDPEILSKWWGPDYVTNPVCDIDLKVGGAMYVVMLAGKELGALAGQRWPMRGAFKEIIPNKKLVFINNAVDEQDNVLLKGETTVLFNGSENETNIIVTTIAEGRVPQAPQMIAGMEMGWNQSLDKLVKLF